MGIYNVGINMDVPAFNLTNAGSIVFKAVTNDTIPVTAYVGFQYSLTLLEKQ
jgi:hypothetical protein